MLPLSNASQLPLPPSSVDMSSQSALQNYAESKSWRFPERKRLAKQPPVVVRNFVPVDEEDNAVVTPSTPGQGSLQTQLDPKMSSSVSSVTPLDLSSTLMPPCGGESVLHLGSALAICASNAIYASVVLVITILLFGTSIITIMILCSSESLKDVVGYYLISLSVTDLFSSVLVTPFAIYASLNDQWRFNTPQGLIDSGNPWLCKIESYLCVMFWSTHVYMFMWIAVDRYAAVHKPSRYEVEQTFTRCKCWILFTWITSLLLCCPVLFTSMEQYYPEVKLCLIDWSVMPAYSATLAVLVVIPTFCSIVHTCKYVCKKWINLEYEEQETRTIFETDAAIMMVFIVMAVFVVSWLPWFVLRLYESINEPIGASPLHFCLLWLGISQGCWKLVIYLTVHADFRRGFRDLCGGFLCFCRRNNEKYSQYIDLQQQRTRYL